MANQSNAFKHRRDFRQSRTHVLVKGVGSEVGGSGLQLVYAEYTAHAGDYPCRYLPDGWGGEPITSPEIDTLAKATEAATAIGQRLWGALGTLEWESDGIAVGGTALTHFHQGDLVDVFDPTEGQNHAVYPLRNVDKVAGTTGHPRYLLTVGDVQPDIIDILRGVTVVNPIQAQLRGGRGGAADAAGTGLGASGQPGTPKQIPTTNTPTHSNRNVARGQGAGTTAFTTRTAFVDPADPPPTTYAAQLRSQYYDSATGVWKDGFTTSGLDGRPHPNSLHLGSFTADGTYPVTLAIYQMILTGIDLAGTGSVVLLKNNAAVTGTISGHGHHTIAPVPLNPSPLPGVRGDTCSVTLSGTSSGDPLWIVVWEA